MQHISLDIAAAYASLFVHCAEYYAIQQRDGSYYRVLQPLTVPLIAGHLSGRYTLGTYLLDNENNCSFAVFDADGEDGLHTLASLSLELANQEIPTLLEASRRGGHLWVFFSEPTPARLARAWLLPYARSLSLEFYPKQDERTFGGPGSLIRLPLGIHQESRTWYPFLQLIEDGKWGPVGETVITCCKWVYRHVQWVTPPDEIALLNEVQATSSTPVPGERKNRPGRGSIRDWCLAQDIHAVIGRYMKLDHRGIGSCPFKEHHHQGDRHPSFQVFEGEPGRWYCYTWQRGGDLFDFLCLYHNITPQEGWIRLQEGWLF